MSLIDRQLHEMWDALPAEGARRPDQLNWWWYHIMSSAELNLARRLQLGDNSPLEVMRVLLSGRRVTAPNRNEFADEGW